MPEPNEAITEGEYCIECGDFVPFAYGDNVLCGTCRNELDDDDLDYWEDCDE